MSPPVRPDPTPLPSDPAARPRSFAQRLGLLLILLVLPMAAVTVPTLMVTHIFGQHPTPKSTPPSVSDTSGLRRELDRRADNLLPTPAPLVAEPIRVSVRDPSHVGPRAEKVKAQAQRFGGSAVEGLAADGEKHLFVDLPAGAADAFRTTVLSNLAGEILASPPPTTAARDQVEVFIRAAGSDE